jgi:dihydrofolate reductase
VKDFTKRLRGDVRRNCVTRLRGTWQLFAKIWPGRDDEFSTKLNTMPKLVASRSLEQAGEWQNSTVLQGDLAAEVKERKQARDIVVIGSASVLRTLAADDLVIYRRPEAA